LHFGLANYPVLEKAEIFWPDGKKEVLTNLASDRFDVVHEGRDVISSSPRQRL
jgi:ASPIC and UnbV